MLLLLKNRGWQNTGAARDHFVALVKQLVKQMVPMMLPNWRTTGSATPESLSNVKESSY